KGTAESRAGGHRRGRLQVGSGAEVGRWPGSRGFGDTQTDHRAGAQAPGCAGTGPARGAARERAVVVRAVSAVLADPECQSKRSVGWAKPIPNDPLRNFTSQLVVLLVVPADSTHTLC